MNIITTNLPGVIVIEPKVYVDKRGFFLETFREDVLLQAGINAHFVQDNHTRSSQGVLRGLHYQTEQTQGKLVRVTKGEVYDVAVDMRKDSPTFGRHVGVLLSAESKRQLWVPEGFAHGFYVTTESAEFVYKCTDYYAPQFEQSVLWNDPSLDIQWPLVNGQTPLLSEKDKAGLLLVDAPVF